MEKEVHRKFSDNVSLQNKELISASALGDVMTVVSLLNSGADVQTEDEVHITFSVIEHYNSKSPYHYGIFVPLLL